MSDTLKVTTVLDEDTTLKFIKFRDSRDVPTKDAMAARVLITRALNPRKAKAKYRDNGK